MAETTAEIIYSQVDRASVALATSATGEVAQAAELALFVLYAGHVFADIGPKPWALDFSSALGELDEDERTQFAALDQVVAGVRIDAQVNPSEARVGFGAWLLHDDEISPGFFYLADQKHWRLKVHLPWRERHGGNHYFTTSVALLLHFLLRKNMEDASQQERLIDAARLVAALHRDRELRLPAYWTQAVGVGAERAWGVIPAGD